MWRQTGPVIISISYMILDVLVFLFIFVIVYVSFTLVTVYVYNVYNDERTAHFNTHASAFKLFFWAMIRTGNPQYAGNRNSASHNSNSPLHSYASFSVLTSHSYSWKSFDMGRSSL